VTGLRPALERSRPAVDERVPGPTPGARTGSKALIKVGYACNEHCSFCHTLDVRHVQGSTAEVDRKIRRAAELGHEMVVLSGGEPTIRPELIHWATLTASLGLDFGLVTNGQMLAYPEVVEKLIERRLRYVYLSLHGGTRKIHNLMVRSDAFDAAFQAIRNLTGRGLDFSVNCVITKHNVEHLRGLVDTLLPFSDVAIKFSMVEPKGGGDKLFDHLMPRVEQVAEQVMDAIAYGDQRVGELGQRGPTFSHGAIPLCLMPGYEDRFDDLKTHAYRTMIEVGEPDFFPVDDLNKTHAEPCRGCALRGPCPGLYKGYHEVFGATELHPRRDRPRSNSFNYELAKLVTTKLEASSHEHCPLRGELGVTPWDRGRDLYVRNGGRLARFRAESRDFSDVEILEIKHELGQLYLDASRKAAPDDFARDLVQLRRSSLCDGCPNFADCTGMFEPVFEDVFTRDDAKVRELLGQLRGDVLDLGCGEGPYADIFAPLAISEQIRYLGVDPDAAAIAGLRERWPWATLIVSDGEQLELDQRGLDLRLAPAQSPGPSQRGLDLRLAPAQSPGPSQRGFDLRLAPAQSPGPSQRGFDHVLILRSWNHLREPERVLARLLPRVRAGGSLTIVDNVAFGLARTRGQTQRAERSRAAFEHYRNDTLADAAAVLAGFTAAFGLVELARLEVGRQTSNQWLLHVRVNGP
jgi:MoaA/NifB/PqqE/SkfB family radical SAM enzyme/SAM-dependent methyltransferase